MPLHVFHIKHVNMRGFVSLLQKTVKIVVALFFLMPRGASQTPFVQQQSQKIGVEEVLLFSENNQS